MCATHCAITTKIHCLQLLDEVLPTIRESGRQAQFDRKDEDNFYV